LAFLPVVSSAIPWEVEVERSEAWCPWRKLRESGDLRKCGSSRCQEAVPREEIIVRIEKRIEN